jgi:hypothetical protein
VHALLSKVKAFEHHTLTAQAVEQLARRHTFLMLQGVLRMGQEIQIRPGIVLNIKQLLGSYSQHVTQHCSVQSLPHEKRYLLLRNDIYLGPPE